MFTGNESEGPFSDTELDGSRKPDNQLVINYDSYDNSIGIVLLMLVCSQRLERRAIRTSPLSDTELEVKQSNSS